MNTSKIVMEKNMKKYKEYENIYKVLPVVIASDILEAITINNRIIVFKEGKNIYISMQMYCKLEKRPRWILWYLVQELYKKQERLVIGWKLACANTYHVKAPPAASGS